MQASVTLVEPAAGRVLGLDHVTLPVDELDRAVRFYRDVLGAEVVEVLDRATWRRMFPARPEAGRMERATLRLGRGPALQLFVAAQRSRRGDEHPHWAFAIAAADVDVFARRLTAAGIDHVGPVALGPLGHVAIYLRDPAGNLLELTASGYAT